MNPPHEKFPSTKVVLVALSFVCAPFAARADVSWNGSVNTDWANATNWTGGLPSDPGSGNAIVNPGAPGTSPVVGTAGNSTSAQLYLSIGGALQIVSGGSLAVASDLVTGNMGNSGVVDVSGGALTIGGTLNLGVGGNAGSVNISGGTVTANNLSINSSGGARMNLGGTGSFVAPLSNLGNVNFWIANAIIKGFGNTNGWWVNVDTNSQPGQLVLMPAGLVDNLVTTYSNVMNYAGPTIITNNGVLTLAGGDNRLNTATNVVVASGILDLGGNNQTVAGLTGEGTVTSIGGVLTVNIAGGEETFAGLLAGAGGLNKTGAGTLVLSGPNTYHGSTSVNDGTLSLATNGTLFFAIGESGSNTSLLGSGGLNLDGSLILDLSAASSNTNSIWRIVANSLTTTYGTNFFVAGFSGSGGTWTNTTNGVAYIFAQSTGVLSIEPTNPTGNYDSWVAYWQGVYPGFTSIGGTDNPDGDPFDNNEEFAFDGNPMVGTGALLFAAPDNHNVVFHYVARKDPPGGVTYKVEHTTNLSVGPWTNSSVIVVTAADQSGLNSPADYERKEFVTPSTNSSFFRVRATIVP